MGATPRSGAPRATERRARRRGPGARRGRADPLGDAVPAPPAPGLASATARARGPIRVDRPVRRAGGRRARPPPRRGDLDRGFGPPAEGLTCTIYDREMPNQKGLGPTPEEVTRWITTTYPKTFVAEAMGATFFSLTAQHWPNFATIVTTDEHDMGSPSDLARDGVFRLNIGVGKATFERLVGGAT